MDLSYDSEYQDFRQEVRKFLADNEEQARGGGMGMGMGPPSERVQEWQKQLIERGYAARTVPREFGGYGGEPDLLKRVILDEEFAEAGASPGVRGQGPDMLVPTLLEHGTQEQKQKWVGPTIRGEVVWCQGYSEPGSGSDLASLQTRATEDGQDFLINGQKIWTSSAHFSDMMFCLVRTEPDASKHAVNQVFLTDVRVPQTNVVGRRGEGWKIANTTLKHERNMLGNSGQLEASLQRLVKLMEQETVNGVRALDSPIYRDRLLQLQARTLAARYHSLRLLTANRRGDAGGIGGLVVKLTGCELSHQIAALALDVMGELGTLHQGSKYLRAGGAWQFQHMFSLGLIIGGGTAQIQKNIIAERGLGMPREPKPGKEIR